MSRSNTSKQSQVPICSQKKQKPDKAVQNKTSAAIASQVNDFINISQTIIFFWNVTGSWFVEYVSDNISMFGYDKALFESGKLNYSDIIHPEDYNRVCRELQEYTKSQNDQFMQTYRILTAEKTIRWIECRSNIKYDEQHNATHYLSSIVDIKKK
ncbi:MAG: hypothetical protein DSZ03_08225, partial [Sulfurimonas sp.]